MGRRRKKKERPGGYEKGRREKAGSKQTEHSRKENLRREERGLGMWKSLYVV